MKQIQKRHLEKLKTLYLNNDIYSISRHALSRNKISDLVRNTERTEFTQNQFSIDIQTLPVTNQMQSGRCWIFAGCNILREYTAKKYKLKNFELSQNYISFYDKLEKSNFFLEKMIELKEKPLDDRLVLHILDNPIDDGGQWDMFVNIVKKYGVVPKNAYPETFQSSNTDQLDKILNRYLRKITNLIRDNKSVKQLNEIKQTAMDNIYYLLCSSFGVPPTKFSFEYVDKNKKYHCIDDLTPKRFFSECVGINLDNYVSIINAPTKDKSFNKLYYVKHIGNVCDGKPVTFLNLEMKRFKQIVLSQLSDKNPVWFGSDCDKYGYFNTDEYLWDDKSYNEDLLLQIDSFMTKDEMLDYRESQMNHAMVLTGVNIKNNKPTKWKIQNSWGEKIANKGYFVATDSWFDRFVYQAVVNKKYLTEEEKQLLNMQKIPLDPWDPMGTLAK